MSEKLKKVVPLILIFFTVLIIQNCKKADLITTPTTETCDSTVLTYIDFFPAWSPDGSKIIFYNNGSSGNACGIYSIDTNGTNKRLLRADCNARNPVWSADGNWIVFESANLLFKIPAGGGDTIGVTSVAAYYPSWSKNNQWIAFDSNDSLHYYAIWKIRPDNSGKKLIGELNSSSRMPDWSFDGKYICYQKAVSQTQIYIMDTLGSPGVRVTNNDRRDFFPKFSPDGSKILYQSQTSTGCINIWVINTNGTGDTRLTNFQSEQASWSPDGQMIVYVNVEKDNGHLWIMKKDGTGIRQLTYQ